MNNLQERIEKLESFLALDSNNPELVRDLAEVCHRAGNQRRALELYERLKQLTGETPEVLNAIGSAYLAEGKWDDAAAMLRQAVEKAPQAASLNFNLGYAEFGGGHFEQAVPHFERAVDLGMNDNVRLYYFLAHARYHLDNPQGARAALDKVVAMEPEPQQNTLLLSAYLDMEQGNFEQAGKTAEKAAKKYPQSADALWLQGQLALLNLDAEKGVRVLRQASSIRPDDAYILTSLGQGLLMLQRAKQAEETLLKAVRFDPHSMTAHIALAWAYLLQNDAVSAERIFRLALQLDDQEAEAHAGMALVYFAQSKFPEAEGETRRALEIDPNSIAARLVQSALAQQKGKTEEAARIAQRLFEGYTFGPLGWMDQNAISKIIESPTGKHVINKYLRLARRRGAMKP